MPNFRDEEDEIDCHMLDLEAEDERNGAMTHKEIIASLKKHNGKLCSSTNMCFEGRHFTFVAKFDSGLDSEEWSDETGLGGPSDFVDGIFHTWFNNQQDGE